MNATILEVGISTATSTIICTAINLEPLFTALVAFAVSLVTVVGGELIKFLVAFLKNKTAKYSDKKEEGK